MFVYPSMPAYYNAREAEALRRAKMELQSLQTQACMRRRKTSETIPELISFVSNKLSEDLLIYPDKDNPFKPKKVCTILWIIHIVYRRRQNTKEWWLLTCAFSYLYSLYRSWIFTSSIIRKQKKKNKQSVIIVHCTLYSICFFFVFFFCFFSLFFNIYTA